jgi:hypothetical protein
VKIVHEYTFSMLKMWVLLREASYTSSSNASYLCRISSLTKLFRSISYTYSNFAEFCNCLEQSVEMFEYLHILFLRIINKYKVIPVQAVEALRVARGWGSHIFRHSAHRWRQGCQPYAPTAFYSQEDPWYSFLLEAESIPGPWCGWKE